MTLSTLPPRKPAVAPQAMPSATEASVASRPTISEMRPPIRQRTSRSRPDSSVPHQCMFFQVGGSFIASQSALSNSCGSKAGPSTQTSAISSSTARLATRRLVAHEAHAGVGPGAAARAAARLAHARARIGLQGPGCVRLRGGDASRWHSVPDLRVERRVGQVDQQVQQHCQHRDQHHQAQHQRVVAVARAVDDQPCPGPAARTRSRSPAPP